MVTGQVDQLGASSPNESLRDTDSSKLSFRYDQDGLGEKLVTPWAFQGDEQYSYTIRPVRVDGEFAEVTPATFSDFDIYSLYIRPLEGLDEWLEDFDTIPAAINWAVDHYGESAR